MVLIYILLYFVFLVVVYVVIEKRLKILSSRHSKNTGIESLSRWHLIIRRKMILILSILFILISLVILTYFGNGILFKTWLYNNQETLDSNDF